MGYSMFDTVELKESSPSVFYLEYFEKYGTGQEDIKSYDVIKNPIVSKGTGVDKRIANSMPTDDETEEDVLGDEELVEEMDDEASDDTVIANKPISMSASRLQTLLACPLKYYYKYVDYLTERNQLEKRNSSWLNVVDKGNLFHRTMEEYCNRVIKQREITEYNINDVEFENIYAEEVYKMVEEVPYISQVIFEKERDENKEVHKRFLEGFYADMKDDYTSGKRWRVLGCEVAFDEVKYNLEEVIPGEGDIELSFNGNIDRLDGYVDDSGMLHLRVIDYKTGAKLKKKNEVNSNKQIQHFVYALAIQSYVDSNKEALEGVFGKSITSHKVEEVSYIFPYEHSSNEKYSVMDKVEANMESGKYKMPAEVNIKAWKVLHSIKGQYNKAVLAGIVCSEEKWEATCEYCKYTRVCRMKMGNEL